jgi:DNA polymerase III gamma/tau subunit
MEKFNDACFIFCTNNYQYVIESIQSRCYFFPFQLISKEDLKTYSVSILKKENIQYDDEIFDVLYDFTKGDMRKYLINLQSASHENSITHENLLTIIKKPFSNTMEKIIEFTQKNDRVICMNEINSLLAQGYNHGDIIKYLFDYCIGCELEQNLKLKYLDIIGQAQITNARGLYSNIQLDYLMIQLCEL